MKSNNFATGMGYQRPPFWVEPERVMQLIYDLHKDRFDGLGTANLQFRRMSKVVYGILDKNNLLHGRIHSMEHFIGNGIEKNFCFHGKAYGQSTKWPTFYMEDADIIPVETKEENRILQQIDNAVRNYRSRQNMHHYGIEMLAYPNYVDGMREFGKIRLSAQNCGHNGLEVDIQDISMNDKGIIALRVLLTSYNIHFDEEREQPLISN